MLKPLNLKLYLLNKLLKQITECDAPSTGYEAETPGPIQANAPVTEYPLEDNTNRKVSIDANKATTEAPKEERGINYGK